MRSGRFSQCSIFRFPASCADFRLILYADPFKSSMCTCWRCWSVSADCFFEQWQKGITIFRFPIGFYQRLWRTAMAKKKKARATNAAAITPSAPPDSAGEMASAVKAVQWLASGAKSEGGWTWLEMNISSKSAKSYKSFCECWESVESHRIEWPLDVMLSWFHLFSSGRVNRPGCPSFHEFIVFYFFQSASSNSVRYLYMIRVTYRHLQLRRHEDLYVIL